MVKFLAICQNTFVQTIRQPVFTWMLFVVFLILVLSVPLTTWAMSIDYHRTNQKMLEGLGLGTLLICGLILASLSASSVLSREIEDKTALTVMSKPVSRATFVAGKFFGVAGAVTLFYYLSVLVYLMTVRHRVVPAAFDKIDWPVIILGFSALALALAAAVAGNVLFNWTFTSAFVYAMTSTLSVAMGLIAFIGKGWQIVPFGDGLRGQLFLALALLALALLVFSAIAVAASTRFGQVATLLICLGVLAVGSEHTRLFDQYKDRIVLSHAAHWVLPNLGYFYAIDALTLDNEIPPSFVGLAAAYCACYIAGVLALGAAMFERRSLEGRETSATLPGVVGFLAACGQVAAVLVALVGVEAGLEWLTGMSIPAPILILLLVGAGAVWHLSGITVTRRLFSLEVLLPVTLGAYTPAIVSFIMKRQCSTLELMAPLIAAGAAMWMFWGLFARGNRWCYWILTGLTVAASAAALVSLAGLWADPARIAGAGLPVPFVLLAMLLSPRTRRHFITATVEAAP